MVLPIDFVRFSHHSNELGEALTLAAGAKMALFSLEVEAVLSRLYDEAAENDARVEIEEQEALKAAEGGSLNEETLASIQNRTFMAVAPEVGRLLYLLVRIHKPSLIVEFGSSFGISAIHLAAALRDNGSGRILTTEQSSEKASRAVQHFEQAGLSDLIELRQGDAFETLEGVEKIDMLILDGWKPLYLPLLQQLESVLAPHCLVVADDVISLAAKCRPYLDYVRDRASGYVSCEIPLDDGVELSFR
jgi:predicted O-methyltransferase YrrM